MKKSEDYIKPVTFESLDVDPVLVDSIRKQYYQKKNSGALEKELQKLYKKQKNASTTNGPHPHH